MADELWAIVPALDLVDLTLQTCEDLLAQSIPVRVLLIDQGSSTESNDAFRAFADHHHPRVLLWSFTTPLPSLSAAWNAGLRFVWSLGHEEAWVCNSDVRVHPEMATELRQVRQETGALFVTGVGVTAAQFANFAMQAYELDTRQHGGPDFSCFLTTKAGHDRYPFDEAFIPAFMEDCDLHRRYMLGGDGAKIFSINLPFHHIGGGSRTINQSDAARAKFERVAGIGRAYYHAKWGGGPNHETFVDPFGPVQYPHATNPELQANLQAGRAALESPDHELSSEDAIHAVELALTEKMAAIRARETREAAEPLGPDSFPGSDFPDPEIPF
jgi:hypothetical protein